MQKPRTLRRRRLAPWPVERRTRRFDRSIDVGLAGHRGSGERLTRRRLRQVTDFP